MAAKKVPFRMCVGCREMKPKRELIRVVKTPQGEILLDATGKLGGRGAYICKCSNCVEKAQKINALAKAFETSVSASVYGALKGELEKIEQ